MCLGAPGLITEIRESEGTRMATIDFGGIIRDICLAYVPQAVVGDYALAHAGFVVSLSDEATALQTRALFAELGQVEAQMGVPADVAIVDTRRRR